MSVSVPHPQSFEERNALESLAVRSVRLATIVQAASRRRDVRDLRAKILGLLLALRCPVGSSPARAWYVPGGVARLGISGLARAWRGFYGEEAPTERTLRAHLGTLERACAVVRVPGDWIPTAPGAPRLRHPDTILLLEDERDARFWADEGLAVLEREPEARIDPTLWRRLFRGWRDRARDPQARLPFPAPEARPDQDTRPAQTTRQDAAAVREALQAGDDLALLGALRKVGADPDRSVLFRLLRQSVPLRRAAALFAEELERGTRIRNRPGWIVWAFRAAGGRLVGSVSSRANS